MMRGGMTEPRFFGYVYPVGQGQIELESAGFYDVQYPPDGELWECPACLSSNTCYVTAATHTPGACHYCQDCFFQWRYTPDD